MRRRPAKGGAKGGLRNAACFCPVMLAIPAKAGIHQSANRLARPKPSKNRERQIPSPFMG